MSGAVQRLRVALASLLVAVPVASIVLGSSPARADEAAFMTIVVNLVERGETLSVLREGDVLVETLALERAGVHRQGGATEVIDGRSFVSLRSLAPRAVYELDEKALSIRLTVAAAWLDGTVIDLHPTRPEHLDYRSDTSAFLNYSLRLTDLVNFGGYTELGISHKTVLIYSGLSLSSATWIPVRGQSNVTFDQPTKMFRWIFGDTFASSGSLGGGSFLAGITFSRNFSLDPYYYYLPRFGFTGAATTPSTLEVYVNNQLVRREQIQPGGFDLKNLPVTAGSGSTRYVLRDAFGRTTELSSNYYLSPGLLAKGVQDWSYSLGLRRNNVATESFNYTLDNVALFARHRLGLTDWLTGGYRLEATFDVVSGGVSLGFRTPIGEVQGAFAASAQRDGDNVVPGVAGLLSYNYLSRHVGVNINGLAESDGYSTVSQKAADDRTRFQGGASISVPFGPRVSATAQGAVSWFRDAGWRARVGGLVNIRITPALFTTLSGAYLRNQDGTNGFEAFVSLTYAFVGNHIASIGWQQNDNRGAATAELQKPLPRGEGFGYQFRGTLGPDPADKTVMTQVQYQSQWGRYGVEYDYLGKHSVTLETAGAFVAIAHGGVFATRPILDSFALLQIPGVGGVRGYLNNQLAGRTNKSGNLLIPDLLSYYGNKISVADADIPLDRTISYNDQLVAPPWRGGVRLLMPVRHAKFFRGRLVVGRKKSAVPPAFGELTVRGPAGVLVSPIGSNGEFELEGELVGQQSADVEWTGGRCQVKIEIPPSSDAVVELGELRCLLPKGTK